LKHVLTFKLFYQWSVAFVTYNRGCKVGALVL